MGFGKRGIKARVPEEGVRSGTSASVGEVEAGMLNEVNAAWGMDFNTMVRMSMVSKDPT